MRLVALALITALAVACDGSPIEDDGSRPAPTPIPADTASLPAASTGQALEELAEALRRLDGRRAAVIAALEMPVIEEENQSLAIAFRQLTALEFQVGRLAELLALACGRQPDQDAATVAAEAALSSLAVSAYAEIVRVLDVQAGLDEESLTVNEARNELAGIFFSLRQPGGDDTIALLPDGAEPPTLTLATGPAQTLPLAETTASFAEVADALEPETLAEIAGDEEVSNAAIRIATLSRLALLTGEGSQPPSSVFGLNVLSLSVAGELVYTAQAIATVGVLPGSGALVSLAATDERFLGIRVLRADPVDPTASPTTAASGRVESSLSHLPSIGRPLAVLREDRVGYQLEISMSFVNPANTPFSVTCVSPLAGGRSTATLSGRRAAGDLVARARLTLGPQTLEELRAAPGLICIETYGTLETGRLRLPPAPPATDLED